jgi:hypothetical protein
MTEKKQITISEDEFYEKYNPIKNHFRDDALDAAAFDGFMFETYGEEVKFVEDHIDCPVCKRGIWTIIEAEGNLYFVSGFHYVNRVGYLLTEEFVEVDTEIEVKIDNEIDDEPSGPFNELGYEATSDED